LLAGNQPSRCQLLQSLIDAFRACVTLEKVAIFHIFLSPYSVQLEQLVQIALVDAHAHSKLIGAGELSSCSVFLNARW
jgi:hypothetical protein